MSYEPVNPPHFKRQEHFGPFIKRDSGAYWIYFSEGALLPYEEKLIKKLRSDSRLSTDSAERPQMEIGMMWFPLPEQSRNPLVIYVPLDAENILLKNQQQAQSEQS